MIPAKFHKKIKTELQCLVHKQTLWSNQKNENSADFDHRDYLKKFENTSPFDIHLMRCHCVACTYKKNSIEYLLVFLKSFCEAKRFTVLVRTKNLFHQKTLMLLVFEQNNDVRQMWSRIRIS